MIEVEHVAVGRRRFDGEQDAQRQGDRDDREEQAPFVAVHGHTISQTRDRLSAIASYA